MAQFTVVASVTNASGITSIFNTFFEVVEAPVIDDVTIVPQSAPAGTLRTITIFATDPQGQTLTYAVTVNGEAATATAQPNVFTFVA